MEEIERKTTSDQKKIEFYKNIINEHFKFIEKQCFKVIRLKLNLSFSLNNKINIENEALELCNRVLDKMEYDNYRVLRQFKGKAKMSTYITTIIANQAVDLIRKRIGRSRDKERAKKMGKIGEYIYEMAIIRRLPTSEVYNKLESNGYSLQSKDEVERIVEKIKGKGKIDHQALSLNSNTVVKRGTSINENGETIIPDYKSNPEEILIESNGKKKLDSIIKEVVSQLSGEERLILRMRFPQKEDEIPTDVEQISNVLGISKKAVYNRISRILKKCRQKLNQKGVNINDLL